MGRGWIAAEGKLELFMEGRTEWPTAEIARAGPENIRVLSLSLNLLTAIDGEQLARLSRLEVLDVSDNRLTAIPAEVGRLSALNELDVSWNQLTAIPAEVGRLSALQVLNVTCNKLTAIPAEVGRLPHLTAAGLFAMNNPLTDLPESALVSDDALRAYLQSLSRRRFSISAVLNYLRSLLLPAVPAPAPVPASESEAAGLRRQLQALEAEVASQRQELAGAVRDVSEWRLRAEASESEVAGLRRQLQALEAEVASQRQELAGAVRDVGEWRLRAEASESEAAGLRRQLQALEAEVASQRQDLAGAVWVSEALLRSLSAAQLEALAARLSEASQRVTELRVEAARRGAASNCCVCMERPVGVTLQPCGHTKLCGECAQQVWDRTRQCPECRQAITQRIRVFT